MNDTKTIELYKDTNLDALWDDLSSFNFKESPCMCIFTNINNLKNIFNEQFKTSFIDMFLDLENKFPNDFKLALYDNEPECNLKTIQLEFIDIPVNYE